MQKKYWEDIRIVYIGFEVPPPPPPPPPPPVILPSDFYTYVVGVTHVTFSLIEREVDKILVLGPSHVKMYHSVITMSSLAQSCNRLMDAWMFWTRENLIAYPCRWARGCVFEGFDCAIPWVLMPWLLLSPGHQHPWYWIWRKTGPCLPHIMI